MSDSPKTPKAANQAERAEPREVDSPRSERRIVPPTDEEIRRFGPGEDEGDIEEEIELRSAPPAEPTWTTAEEYVVPRRQPRSDVFVLQRWVTIAGKQGSLVAQDESTYLDFSDYQDAALFVEIGAYTADQSIAIETAPAKLDGWFRPMVTINVSASTIERRVIRWSSATTPPARWIRWRTGNLFSDWSVTFRVEVRGLRAVRPFVTQPPDWIALGQEPPPREIVRVVRPMHFEEPTGRHEVPEGQQLVHYTDDLGTDLPADVRERLEHAGVWRATDPDRRR